MQGLLDETMREGDWGATGQKKQKGHHYCIAPGYIYEFYQVKDKEKQSSTEEPSDKHWRPSRPLSRAS